MSRCFLLRLVLLVVLVQFACATTTTSSNEAIVDMLLEIRASVANLHQRMSVVEAQLQRTTTSTVDNKQRRKLSTTVSGASVVLPDDSKIVMGNSELHVDATDQINVNTSFYAPTLDTGNGAHELYAMDQDVQTTDSPAFDSLFVATNVNAATFNGINLTDVAYTQRLVNQDAPRITKAYAIESELSGTGPHVETVFCDIDMDGFVDIVMGYNSLQTDVSIGTLGGFATHFLDANGKPTGVFQAVGGDVAAAWQTAPPVFAPAGDIGVGIECVPDDNSMADGDGINDLLVGAAQKGSVFLLRMDVDGTVKSWKEFSAGVYGVNAGLCCAGGNIGYGFTLADIDNNGILDWIIPAAYKTVGATSGVGVIHVWMMDTNHDVIGHTRMDDTSYPAVWSALPLNSYMGHLGAIATINDMDGNNNRELVIGQGSTSSSKIWVLFLDLTGAPIQHTEIDIAAGTSGWDASKHSDASNVAHYVASAMVTSDLNGDGQEELIFADYSGFGDLGALYVLYLEMNGANVEVVGQHLLYRGDQHAEYSAFLPSMTGTQVGYHLDIADLDRDGKRRELVVSHRQNGIHSYIFYI